MFKSLRDRLKNWTEKISKSKKEEEQEEAKEQEEEKKSKEKSLTKEEKKSEREADKKEKEEKKKQEKLEKKTAKEAKKSQTSKEIPVPMKFNVGTESYQPDLEKLKEIKKEESNISKELEKSNSGDEKVLLEKTGQELKAKAEKLEQETQEKPQEKKSFFQKFAPNKIKISEKDFSEYREDLEMLLLENNVAFEVADEIIKKLREKIVGKEVLKKELESEIRDSLREIISEILIEPFDLVKKILSKQDRSSDPFVILFFGINGSGKTTSIAKISEFLKKKKLSSVLAAADTFRAASIEQLKEHGSKLGVKVIAHDYGSDPASVGFDAIQYAKKNRIDVVLIDTAGRMHTESNLIREMEKISKVCKPDLKIFIGESITGNDATEQARTFNQNIGVDGIVLSKSDIDEKGGTALSVGFITGKPIIFLGTGQNYKDIEYFDKKKFLDKLGLE